LTKISVYPEGYKQTKNRLWTCQMRGFLFLGSIHSIMPPRGSIVFVNTDRQTYRQTDRHKLTVCSIMAQSRKAILCYALVLTRLCINRPTYCEGIYYSTRTRACTRIDIPPFAHSAAHHLV